MFGWAIYFVGCRFLFYPSLFSLFGGLNVINLTCASNNNVHMGSNEQEWVALDTCSLRSLNILQYVVQFILLQFELCPKSYSNSSLCSLSLAWFSTLIKLLDALLQSFSCLDVFAFLGSIALTVLLLLMLLAVL